MLIVECDIKWSWSLGCVLFCFGIFSNPISSLRAKSRWVLLMILLFIVHMLSILVMGSSLWPKDECMLGKTSYTWSSVMVPEQVEMRQLNFYPNPDPMMTNWHGICSASIQYWLCLFVDLLDRIPTDWITNWTQKPKYFNNPLQKHQTA